jgi:hypothetical protein
MSSKKIAAAVSHSIALTSKSESGLQTLHDLFRDHAATTAMTRTLSSKISSLGYFLQKIRALLEKINKDKQVFDDASAPVLLGVENLECRLDSCQKNIEIWIKNVQDMDLGSVRHCSTLKKGARIAFLTDDFMQIGQQVMDHEHGMTTDMQILFR